MLKSKHSDKEILETSLKYINDHSAVPCCIMEVCGTHTMSIYRHGLRQLLPPHICLISGPGCPVCVTDSTMLGYAMAICQLPGVILTSFGDMLRVPAGGSSLLECRDRGADVRMVLSPLDALSLAEENTDKEVVFFAVGFETTAPLVAAAVEKAFLQGVKNFSVISAHKVMPPVLRQLLAEKSGVDALICPGHVATVMGAKSFNFLADELNLPSAISGFEAADIMLAVSALVQMIEDGEAGLKNCYHRAVTDNGNIVAQNLLNRVFCASDVVWRGFGLIPDSGLALADEYKNYDALEKFKEEILSVDPLADDPACSCGLVVRGDIAPEQCALFGNACTSNSPQGACMVSSEGACAVAYRFRQ